MHLQSVWETRLDEINREAPDTLKSLHTSERWNWLATLQNLVSITLSSVGASLLLALAILSLTTGNILIGLLALVAICTSLALLLAVMVVLLGWTLGIVESIALAVSVGLSVDYIVRPFISPSLTLHNRCITPLLTKRQRTYQRASFERNMPAPPWASAS